MKQRKEESLEETIRAAKREVAQWPKWMRDQMLLDLLAYGEDVRAGEGWRWNP